MRLLCTLVLLSLAGITSAQSPTPPSQESIPEGALQRLGTSRFRADEDLLDAIFTPDGKSLVGYTNEAIYLWDAESGIRRKKLSISDGFRPISARGVGRRTVDRDYCALHPNGRILACFSRTVNVEELQLWNLLTGEKMFAEQASNQGSRLEWTPDGKYLVESTSTNDTGSPMVKIRNETGSLLISRSERLIRNTDRIGTGNWNNDFRVLNDSRMIVTDRLQKSKIVDLLSGSEAIAIDPAPKMASIYSLAISSDRKKFAFLGDTGIQIYDSETGKREEAFEPAVRVSAIGRMLFSPDGQTLYYSGPNLRAYHIADKKESFLNEAAASIYLRLTSISPDGKKLCALRGSQDRSAVLLDAQTGKEEQSPPGIGPLSPAVWLPDNRTLAMRGEDSFTWSLWDSANGNRIKMLEAKPEMRFIPSFPVNRPINRTSLLEGGKKFLDLDARDNQGFGVIWDLESGKIDSRLLPADHAIVSSRTTNIVAYRESDDKLLLSQRDTSPRRPGGAAGQPAQPGGRGAGGPGGGGPGGAGRQNPIQNVMFWWNLETDKKEKEFRTDFANGLTLFPIGEYLCEEFRTVRPLTPRNEDDPFAIRFYRAADGKLFRTLKLNTSGIVESASRRASLLLCAASPTARNIRAFNGMDAIPIKALPYSLWELASGKPILEWETGEFQQHAAIFPGGDFIVQALDDSSFALYEPFVAKKRLRVFKTPSRIDSFTFSQDGKRLAVGFADTTIGIYDCSNWAEEVLQTISKEAPIDALTLWNQLNAEPGKAYRAARMLTLFGDRAVALLKEKIPGCRPADEKMIAQWVADLDSPKFAIREKASRELDRVGIAATEALKKALAADPDAEVKSRAEKLLESIRRQVMDSTTLRELRAVQILLWIDSAAARDLLKSWASENEGTALAQAAKKALE